MSIRGGLTVEGARQPTGGEGCRLVLRSRQVELVRTLELEWSG